MSESHVYIDGRFLPASRASVPLLCGGFLYGEGVFTTLRLYRGRTWDIAGHLERLRDNAIQLDLACPPELDDLGSILAELARRNGLADDDARARVMVWRGPDAERVLPLTDLGRIPVMLGAVIEPLAPALSSWQREGIHVLTLEAGSDRGSLADLKSLCYLASVLALRRAAAAGCAEALLLDPTGRVLEGATSNVFAVREDGRLVTPRAAGGLLAGRTRARVIALADAHERPVLESDVFLTDLERAHEIFMTGSVKEVVPVVALNDKPVGDGGPGPVTRLLQAAYTESVRATLAATP